MEEDRREDQDTRDRIDKIHDDVYKVLRRTFWLNVAFVVVILITVGGLYYVINNVRDSRAPVREVQKTNCQLRGFVLSSAQVRKRLADGHRALATKLTGAAKRNELKAAKADDQAVEIATKLADTFEKENCFRRLHIKSIFPPSILKPSNQT